MGARRASGIAVAAVVTAVLFLTLLVTWAASIGPRDVLTGDGVQAVRITPTSPSTASPEQEELQLRTEEQDDLARDRSRNDVLNTIALVAELLLLVAVVYLLQRAVRWAWQTWQARRRPDPPSPDVDFAVLGSPERLSEQLAADAAVQRGVLLGGSPRNAVVEAWSRFETQAEAAGASRRPWETSSEFTLRVLDVVGADRRAVVLLESLFREARFSDHELSEVERAEALAALDRIHDSLGSFTGEQA